MKRQAGFTLIELMITVAIIAILAAVALPNYNNYIRRGKIVEGTSTLLSMRTKMEQYFQDNRSYTAPSVAVIAPCAAGSSVPVPILKYFTITCPTLNQTQYTIQADGGSLSSGDNSMQGIHFTINQANVRSTTVDGGSTMANAGYTSNATCWTTKQGGQC
jgi:type IV pilus assembly protein PilE